MTTSDRPACGAAVLRCCACGNTLGVGDGDVCRKCGGPGEDSTCRNRPVDGATRCRKHGGRAPQVLSSAAVRRDQQAAQELLEQLGDSEPVTNPYRRLLELAGEADQWLTVCRQRIGELEALEHVDAFGVERSRAMVDAYTAATQRLAQILVSAAKLDLGQMALALDERVTSAQLDVVVRAIDHAIQVLPTEVTGPFREAVALTLRAAPDGGPLPALPPGPQMVPASLLEAAQERIRLLEAGLSTRAIAAATGVSHETARQAGVKFLTPAPNGALASAGERVAESVARGVQQAEAAGPVAPDVPGEAPVSPVEPRNAPEAPSASSGTNSTTQKGIRT